MFIVDPVHKLGSSAKEELSPFNASKIVNLWGSPEKQDAVKLARKNGITVCRLIYYSSDKLYHAEEDCSLSPNVYTNAFTYDYVVYPAIDRLRELKLLDEALGTGWITKGDFPNVWGDP